LPEKNYKYCLLGTLAGLAYLRHLEGVLLLLVLLLTPASRKFFQRRFFLLFGFPAKFLLNMKNHGSPFYSFYTYHFRVLHYREGSQKFYHRFSKNMAAAQKI